jgi:hypothetical protein
MHTKELSLFLPYSSVMLSRTVILFILENTTFLKLNLFPSSGEVRETPTLLGLLGRASISHWAGTQLSRCLPPLT